MNYPMFKVAINIEESLAEVRKVLESGFLNEGKTVTDFKNKLKSIFKVDNIVLTNSCTSALTMALKLSGVSPGDEVITTSMTCLATNTPIINLGASPVWADINYKTGTIDPTLVESLITDKTKALICVNWAGNPCDLKALLEICNKNKIKLIQDAAHSLGTRLDGLCISKFADFTCFSFQAIKHLTTGDGGALVCKDVNDYKRAKPMKWFGLDRDSAKDENGEWKGQRWELDVKEAGYKFHMNNITAAIGLANTSAINNKIESHKKNAKIYEDEFKQCENIELLEMPAGAESSYWVFTILTKIGRIKRNEVLIQLNDLGINAGLVHTPNHFYTCFNSSYKELKGVNRFADSQISLPCGWWLNESDIRFISKKLIDLIEV